MRLIVLLLIQFPGPAFLANAQYTKLLDFTGNIAPANGGEPENDLFFDGTYLYGLTRRGGTNDLGTIFKVKPDGTGYVKMYEFTGGADNQWPNGGLVSDGAFLYGTTRIGANAGTIFKIMPDGTGFATIYTFTGSLPNPISPSGSLIYDGNFLYGMTETGGSALSLGAVFKIRTDGTGFVQLTNFGTAVMGQKPVGKLFTDGTYLYGVTERGGSSTYGVIFRILPDGTGLTKLHEFSGANGRSPLGGLSFDGTFLYGFTELGGAFTDGTMYRIKPDGTSFGKLFDFQFSTVGSLPQGVPAILGPYIYGMTFTGGASTQGNLFRINPDGTGHLPIMDFTGPNGNFTVGCSLLTDDFFLYGMTSYGGVNDLGTLFKFYVGPPVITSFTPAIGPIGTSLTINGNYFSSTISNNVVHFGGVLANVTAATTNQLTVTVPAGTAHDRISVMVNGLAAFSRDPFIVNFDCDQSLTSTSFAPKVDLVTGLDPYALAQADFDQDGKVDLVSANYSASTASVFLNTSTGPGNTTYAAKIDFTTGLGRPYAITTGDFDGNGKLDFAVANEFTNTISVFRNTSSGPGNISFAARVDFGAGPFPHGISVSDFNNDGKADIAVTSNNLDVVSLFTNTSLGPGNISFAARIDFATGSAPQDVSHADLDGDGKPDLVVTNYSDNTLSVLHNTSVSGTITFAPKIDLATGDTPNFVSVGDLDGDGKLDLAVANAVSETVSLYRNTSAPGNISFAAKVDVPAIGAFAVALGDLNGDGKIDLAVPDFGSSVSVLQNISLGAGNIDFSSSLSFTTGSTPQFATIGDFDQDGKPDLAIANQSSSTISVLRNVVGTVPPVITGFAPANGPAGTSVTISGTDFDPLPVNNIVYFGATKATVTASMSTQLTVTVPQGATYQPISVLVGCLSAYSGKPFVVTFPGDGSINSSSFAPKVDFSMATRPTEVIFGDLDGDGKADIATINDSSPTVSVRRNSSTVGTISFDARIDLPAGGSSQGMEVGDIDGDGLLDLISVSDGASQVSVHRNASTPGTISFPPRVSFGTGTTPVSVATGDLDQDGRLDLAVVNASSNSVSLYHNTSSVGTISFAPRVNFTTGSNPYDVSILDIDGDSDPDVVVSSRGASIVSIFRNISTPGSLALQARVDISTGAGTQPYGLALGDLDGDGRPDIATANNLSNTVSIIRNVSTPGTITTGSFEAAVSLPNGVDPSYMSFGDVNGDSQPDLIVSNNSGTSIQVYKNTTTAGSFTTSSFAAAVTYTTGTRPYTAKSGDLDGDGRPELVAANASSNTISVLLNTSSSSCVPTAQRNALIALYNSTNGAGWTNNSNWLNPDESTWYGVTVNACNVTNISLDNNLLSGTLPAEIGDLVQLVTLQLPNNSLTGSIPASIGSLSNMLSLELYNNQLSGGLPVSMYGLNNLQTLNLSNNQLTGTIDSQIGNLTSLVNLSLAINQFNGSIPTEMGNLANLQYLRLALNQLTGLLPTTLGSLTQLREFTVSFNLLSGTVPTTLANLTNLTVLGLSFNTFSGALPPGIGSLNFLQQVSVRSNQFTSLPAFTSSAITELLTENNQLHFGHLEPNAAKAGFTYSPQANLAGGSATACEGTTLTIPFTTPGTANQYQWYKDGLLVPGATTSSFVKTTAALTDAGNYVVQVTNTLLPGLTLQSDPFVVAINGAPAAPSVTGASSCTPSSLTLNASGGSPGEYRWYAAATGGTDLGTGNDTFNTPVLSITTTYHVAINNGTCESVRTPVIAVIDAVAKPVIATSNCTATAATVTGPAGFASYAWSNGATTQALVLTAAGSYTLVVTSAGGCSSPPSDPVTFTASFCNQPPTIQPTSVTTTVQGTVTVNVSSMATDLDNNLDLSSLQVIIQPASGATAFINANFELVVDYSNVIFAGTDQLTIELCDIAGACTQEIITIEVAGDITVYNALSPNGDGKNDVFYIQYIDALPDTKQNKVTIFNRWGTVVFETTDYDNTTNVFRGLSSSGSELPSGTYYYVLEFSEGEEKRTGFISLRR